MIDSALGLLAAQINAHLKLQLADEDDCVVLAPVVDREGQPNPQTRNQLALFVLSVAEVAVTRGVSIGQPRPPLGTAPEPIESYCLLAADFDPERYADGLGRIWSASRFFQATPVLTAQSTPDLPAQIARLSTEIKPIPQTEASPLWQGLGRPMLPSMMLRVQIHALEEQQTAVEPLIHDPEPNAIERKTP